MYAGDIVKADSWLEEIGGKVGIIILVHGGEHCRSARVLFDTGITLIRLDNLRLANENW